MRTLIAIPTMGTIQAGFFNSFVAMRRVGETLIANTESSMIYSARELLAQQAIEFQADRILWIDSDMRFNPDLMERLSADLDEGRDFVCGLYFNRIFPTKPVIYKSIPDREKPPAFVDYPQDDIFEIAGCGFGAVMMTTSLYSRVKAMYDEPFEPMKGLGEDIAFCVRAREVGAKLYCDSRIKVGHIGKYEYGEDDYNG